MTRTHTTALLFLMALVFFAGCKKEEDGGRSNAIRIKKITSTNSGSNVKSEEYTYNAQDRVADITFRGYNDSVLFIKYFTYNGSQVQMTYNTGQTYTNTLNSNGYIAGNTYNSKGQILYEPDAIPARNCTWVDDNMTMEEATGVFTAVYTYLANSQNTIGSNNCGNFLRGIDSKNLAGSVTVNSSVTTYTYTYDSEGRVATRTSNDGSSTSVTTYEYY